MHGPGDGGRIVFLLARDPGGRINSKPIKLLWHARSLASRVACLAMFSLKCRCINPRQDDEEELQDVGAEYAASAFVAATRSSLHIRYMLQSCLQLVFRLRA